MGSLFMQRQCIMNLMMVDNVKSPTNLVGASFVDQDEFDAFMEDTLAQAMYIYWQSMLYTYFGQHEKTAKLLCEKGHNEFAKGHLSSPLIPYHCLITGLSCFAAAHATKKSKYLRLANTQRKKLLGFEKNGNPNIRHYVALINAEYYVCQKKAPKALEQYKEAIRVASERGFVHDAALASERCGQYYLHNLKQKDEAIYRLDQAIHYWTQYGAKAKVQQLNIKYGSILSM